MTRDVPRTVNRTQRLISAVFAVGALATAAVPALAWTVWPDVDFEWYANVGKAMPVSPAPITAPATAGQKPLVAPGQGEGLATPVLAPRLAQREPALATRTPSFTDEAIARRAPPATPEAYPSDSQRR